MDKPRIDKSRWRSTASDSEWAKVIQRFRSLTDLHDPDGRLRAQRASAILKEEAEALYSTADMLGREQRHDPNPAKYQAVRIARHVIKVGRLGDDVYAKYLTRWAEKRSIIAGTPEDLRALADAAWTFAEALAEGPKNFLEWARRRRRGERGGALPSLALDYLVSHAQAWDATQREVAERLYDSKVKLPPVRDDYQETNPVTRWMGILKYAWSRPTKRPTPK